MSVEGGQLEGGISPPQEGAEWHILGHTYWNRAWCESTFAFETLDPPGTFVPPHIHPTQDEFIAILDGELEVELDGQRHKAPAGSLVKMPRGIPHGYFNTTEEPTRCLFWVSPAGRLENLFKALDGLTDVPEVLRLSALHDVDFPPPEASA